MNALRPFIIQEFFYVKRAKNRLINNMFTDKQTIKDLEIFKPTKEGLSLFALLDKTNTSGGSYCLEKKFRNPLTSIAQIEQVQDTVEFLAKIQ
jgi:DNA mismatch repair ATPase MutS